MFKKGKLYYQIKRQTEEGNYAEEDHDIRLKKLIS